jgi:hypothetical protein
MKHTLQITCKSKTIQPYFLEHQMSPMPFHEFASPSRQASQWCHACSNSAPMVFRPTPRKKSTASLNAKPTTYPRPFWCPNQQKAHTQFSVLKIGKPYAHQCVTFLKPWHLEVFALPIPLPDYVNHIVTNTNYHMHHTCSYAHNINICSIMHVHTSSNVFTAKKACNRTSDACTIKILNKGTCYMFGVWDFVSSQAIFSFIGSKSDSFGASFCLVCFLLCHVPLVLLFRAYAL